MANMLQLIHRRQGLIDRPVGKGIRFLAEEQDQPQFFYCVPFSSSFQAQALSLLG